MPACLFYAASAPAQSITNPIAALKNHITGVAPLTAAQIVTQGNNIQSNIRQVGTNDIALAAALDLVATFDASTNKPLFTTGSTTYGGFPRDGAGDELAQALFDLQQGIIDYTYNNNSGNLTTYYSLLNNTKFGTSTYFPGAVAQPVSPGQGYEVQINATHPEEWGMPNLYVTYAARRPTGCYLAPGSIAEVTVPDSFTNKNWFIRVGCHYWDFSAKSTLKRLDRVSVLYQITSTTTRIANPLGGNIYIEIPYLQTNGIVTVGITNVVRSPFFRNTVVHQTTPTEWLTERTQPGAWADFESDKFMMQVPRKWIYNYANANTVMTNWDKAMDAVSDMLGRPRVQSKTVLYIQPDVLIRSTANEPGYPQVNQDEIYNPNTAETGNKNHYLLTGPQDASWTTFHEMGHGQSFTKFSGETESAVNLLHVAQKCQAFGWSLNAAFSESVADWPNMTLNHAALSWFLPGNFAKNYRMDDTEMKYQHRGHAKYVEVVNLFGWNTLSNFWYSQNVDYEQGASISINADPTDGRILRMSQAAGVDMRPLFHAWGMMPVNAVTLKASIDAAGLKPSLAIYNRLKYYQSILPLTLTAFRQNYNVAKGVVGEPDKSWYVDMYNNYTTAIAYAAMTQLQYIIDLYFPDGIPLNDQWTGAASGVWNTSTVNWKTVATSAPTNYVDGSPGDGVLFDDTLTANPVITLNTTVTPIGVVFSNNSTAYRISGTGGIAGSGDLNKNGTGTVTINTSNTFMGSVVANAGILELGGVNIYHGNTSLSGAAIVRASQSGSLGVGRIFVNGLQTDTCRVELSGGITLSNDLAFRSRSTLLNLAPHILNVSGTNFLIPSLDLALASGGNIITLQSDAGKLVLAAGVTTDQTGPRYLGLLGAGDGEVQGALSTNMALLKLGGGTWTLTGSSPMNGPTIISNGMLMVNGGFIAPANLVTLAGGSLAGNGAVAGAVAVNSGGTIKAGNAASVGDLTLGSLTLGTAVDSHQTINVTAGHAIVAVTGALTNNGLTTLNVSSVSAIANGIYPLVTYTGPAITSGFTLGSMATNVLGTLVYNPGAISLNVTNGNAASGATWDIYTELFDGAGGFFHGKVTTTGGGVWNANGIVTDNGVLTANAGSALLP
ncbi:MAG TPA: M60 family peptidase N-terminal accessory domain-containing protein, partial [bacterium]|nr:M60 family peptidase N-terminal accessory domain-containing protein [bacterium]